MNLRIERVKQDPALAPYICERCEEEGIGVTIHPDLTEDQYVIVSIDAFYEAQKMSNTPASADCLILQECENIGFCIFVVELKSQNTSEGLTVQNLRAKFETSWNDFMALRFKEHFVLPPQNYRKLRCYLHSRIPVRYSQKAQSLKLDALMRNPIEFRYTYIGKEVKLRVSIERELPEPLPIV
jgi:hypothetical protein